MVQATVTEIQRESYTKSNTLSFELGYEKNTYISEYSRLPKVQKFFTEREMYDLFKSNFDLVNIDTQYNYVLVRAENAKPVDWDRLCKAIEFEFDLPYPDGSRMGRVEKAKSAFKKYLE